MVAYRPHRGSLADSLKEMKIFNNIDEMKNYVELNEKDLLDYFEKIKNPYLIQYRDLRIGIDNQAHYDERCGWKTRHVLAYGNCIGMCDIDYQL